MPLAANPFLQTPGAAASKTPAAKIPQTAAEPAKSGAVHFSRVYAKATETRPASGMREQSPGVVAKHDQGSDKVPQKPSAVADSGKPLPGGKPGSADSADQDEGAGEVSKEAPVAAVPAPAAEASVPVEPAQPVPLDIQSAQLAAAAQAQLQPPPVADDGFDPEADPLDDMPAVRLAMEQGGHVSAGSHAPGKNASLESSPSTVAGQAGAVAMLLDPKTDGSAFGEGCEEAFKGLVDDGLKDLKSASSDTRVDDFASRLAALTQAAVPKTANALPVNQPLAMHQSGWTEEVVNRVMYLSSANLKSADIQLEPAELGRLDIRVNLSPDQAAQVNFVSAHAGVREALDSQMHRLREMFAQQGMGQVDVNVSDQSRNWQGQGQEQQAQSRSGGQRLDGAGEDERVMAATEAVAPSVVIGSSAVDYYA
ncbi:flagellar hook-length control protein FliK [Pseudomonas versuta]|uniref:Flagellar hook-length control protein FliK n=1 Tax=Pseudomonas versuta TaxID=1788301 RepID=A0A854A207_9PSED|nr:flagellar hook-length control protein FliK [Pseudomonas versuta]OKA26235.1 flagellar hook-length control protein FliK [Pseudomonas versuta]